MMQFRYRYISAAVLPLILIVIQSGGAENVEFWQQRGEEALRLSLRVQTNVNVAKNVILCIGDGMGVSTVTSARIYKGQKAGIVGEMAKFAFEEFPFVGLSKTFSNDRQVTESGAAANAMVSGTKINSGTLGVNTNVIRGNCSAVTGNEIHSILDWSLEEGKRVGIVTTTRMNHATPAAAYAHSPERKWEHDAAIPAADRELCRDTAHQLIYNNTNINVLFGGGRRNFLPVTEKDPEYGARGEMGRRTDGNNLIQAWIDEKKSRGVSHAYVWNQTAFDHVDPDTTDYMLGLFEPNNMRYSLDRAEDLAGEPSLAELSEMAINILKREDKGYFLLLEGGRIDHAHHDNKARYALDETEAFDDAVRKVVDMTSDDDTLIIVTADHSHPFSMGSWASLNTPILGFVDKVGYDNEPPKDGFPYLSLTYGNGPGKQDRTDLRSGQDTADKNYVFPANIPMTEDTHGGEDVAIYARGPMAQLVSGVHDNQYIAHVMAYASCVGDNKDHCEKTRAPNFKHDDVPSGGADFVVLDLTVTIKSLALTLLLTIISRQ